MGALPEFTHLLIDIGKDDRMDLRGRNFFDTERLYSR